MRSIAVLAVACLVLLVGCRDRGAQDPQATAAEPVAAEPVADPRAEMLGAWTVDVERLPEQANFKAMPEQQRTLALEMARNLLASMTVRFEDGKYAITTAGKTVDGTWRIVGEQGGTLELELTETAAEGAAPVVEKMTLKVDSRGLLMIAAEDEALPLRRKTDDAAKPTEASGDEAPKAPAE